MHAPSPRPSRSSRSLAAMGQVLLFAGILIGSPGSTRAQPEELPACEFVAVAAGEQHSLGLLEDGTVWAWGANEAGQLGDGSSVASPQPTMVLGLALEATAIAAGHRHSLAILSDGSVWTWGRNLEGQLGNGTNVSSDLPVAVVGLAADAVEITAGAFHSMVLLSDGTVWTWGRNTEGQLGDGGSMPSNVPVAVVDLPLDSMAVAAGAYHSLTLLVDGTMRGWGWNNQGQLGDGTFLNSEEPVQVIGLPFDGFQISAGELHSLAVLVDGSVWSWGWNSDGQLGDGSNTFSNEPVAVVGLPLDAQSVAGGANHSLALLVDGAPWAWGRNLDGQLGDGTSSSSTVPVPVAGLPEVAEGLAGGAQHSLAVLADGSAWAWGANDEGQLGTEDAGGSLVPEQVACAQPACLSDADCDDGVACTLDTCDPVALECLIEADDLSCDDGDPCTLDTCDPIDGCLHELPPNQPPLADAGPDRLACTEDDELLLDGSASSDPDEPCDAIVAWDWDSDGDGVFDDATGEMSALPMQPAGVHVIALRVTDGLGASDVDSFLVTVELCNRPPVAEPGGPYEVECAGELTLVPLDGTDSSDPDGDSLDFSWSTDCPGEGFDPATADGPEPLLFVDGPPPCPLTCNVTLTVSDGELSDSSTTSVTVHDTTPPVFVETLPQDAMVDCEAVPDAAVLSATDACGTASVSFLQDREDGPCTSDYTLTRTWTATDACGLITTHVQVVEVRDTTPPSFVEPLPADLVAECGSVPTAPKLTATDACGPATVAFSETSEEGACPSESTLTRTWTATDACGLTTTHVQVVEVRDTTPPSFVEPLPADLVAECGAVPAAPTLTATDACGPATVSYDEDQLPGACPAEYTLTRTWTATDACGLTTTHVQVIDVQDTTPPSFVGALPPDETVECGAVPSAPALSAIDNCGDATVDFEEVRADGDCPGRYSLTRSWTATDSCGLSSVHVQVLSVEDTTPPVVAESRERFACLWPPNHRRWTLALDALSLEAEEACSLPLTWRIAGCSSSQPEDANGDGHTLLDCRISDDGLSLEVRAERQGGDKAGRSYTVLATATDACGNESPPTSVGTVFVPHDQRDKDCRQPSP